MTDSISFLVAGEPQPKGSTRAFYIKKINRVVTTNANKETRGWESRVAFAAQAHSKGFYEEGRLGYDVSLIFVRTRPKSLPKRKSLCITRPDLDKLVRAVLDAISEVLIPDDSQVLHIDTSKRYAMKNEQPGVKVRIEKVRERV